MSTPRQWSLALSLAAAWLLISIAPLQKYLGRGYAAVAYVLVVVAVVAGMQALARHICSNRQIGAGWLALPMAALIAAFAVLYPRSLRLPLTARSDREDALRIVLDGMLHHHYPYDGHTFLGQPPTPLPGAALLGVPFYAMGHIAWQNLFWFAAFCIFALRFFRFRATALLFVTLFLLCAPANLNDLTSGGDYIVNFLYIAIAAAFFHHSLKRSSYLQVAAVIFLSIALSSRTLYAAMLPPLTVVALQHVSWKRTLMLFALVVATAAAITLPIFAPHPIAHLMQQITQNPGKLRYLPPWLHAQQTLPVLGLLVAGAGSVFWRRGMDLPRVFLIFSASAFSMLALPVASRAWAEYRLLHDLSYLSMCVLPFALWAFARFEQAIER